jgi:hypothetical protein
MQQTNKTPILRERFALDVGILVPSTPLGYSHIPLIYQPRRTFHGMRNGVPGQDDGLVHVVKVLKKLVFH